MHVETHSQIVNPAVIGALSMPKSQKPDNVRVARAGDEDKLFDFVREGHEESATFPLSETKVHNFIDAAISGSHPIIIGIIDAPDSDRIAASIAMVYSQWWYTDAWHLDELWCNVHKDYRKSSFGRDLIDFGKWVSDSADKALHMGIITTHRMEAKIAMYRRKLPQMGAIFIYNAEKSGGPAVRDMYVKG